MHHAEKFRIFTRENYLCTILYVMVFKRHHILAKCPAKMDAYDIGNDLKHVMLYMFRKLQFHSFQRCTIYIY